MYLAQAGFWSHITFGLNPLTASSASDHKQHISALPMQGQQILARRDLYGKCDISDRIWHSISEGEEVKY